MSLLKFLFNFKMQSIQYTITPNDSTNIRDATCTCRKYAIWIFVTEKHCNNYFIFIPNAPLVK